MAALISLTKTDTPSFSISKTVVIAVFLLVGALPVALGWGPQRAGQLEPREDVGRGSSAIIQRHQVAQRALQAAQAKHIKLNRSASLLSWKPDEVVKPALAQELAAASRAFNNSIDHLGEALESLEEAVEEAGDAGESSAAAAASKRAQQFVENAQAWVALHPKIEEDDIENWKQ